MVRIALAPDTRTSAAPVDVAHRASATEGEAAMRLLESHGYPAKRRANGQFETRCPFHEGAGPIETRKGTNFYVNLVSSQYYCQSATCGERGNLKTLERHFGIDSEDNPGLPTREAALRGYQEALTLERRRPFYEHGLTDVTIERFRLGYDANGQHGPRYVIPYLEGRRPVAFRYYAPDGDPRWKYTWEKDCAARLFNPGDAVGDADGRVFICEGEQKAMLLVQLGYAAVAVPGASTFKNEWHAGFSPARHIIVCFDNDDPAAHVNERCPRCGEGRCHGHNPGQEAAIKVVESFGWRARNVVLPRPDGARKTDINEFLMRDGHSGADFAEIALGLRKTPYAMTSMRELFDTPPEESAHIVAHGILPVGGRLLVSGAPKVGKSIFVENLALSIASGVPFLSRFAIDEPRRVGVLDRELSRRSLYDRLKALTDARPGYYAAVDNLHIDHDLQVKVDRKDALDELTRLVESNGLEVLVFDTAYKFWSGSFTTEDGVKKGTDTLDELIKATGVSLVLTHHHRKRSGDKTAGGKEGPGDPDDVVGSFLWTGWPNGTILLNFLNRRVEEPFNTVATFTAFRDAAPPEPLALYRDRSSISYQAISDYQFDTDGQAPVRSDERLNTETLGLLLLDCAPIVESDFMARAATHFGLSERTVKPWLYGLLDQGQFERDADGHVPILKHVYSVAEQTYEDERAQLTLLPGGAS